MGEASKLPMRSTRFDPGCAKSQCVSAVLRVTRAVERDRVTAIEIKMDIRERRGLQAVLNTTRNHKKMMLLF
jgi:hypothetical protein